MVMSYTTSPAYHLIVEKKDNYRAASFSEGHYLQVEVAGILKSSKQQDLAKKFITFLISKDAQVLLPTTQWMYPANAAANSLPPEFQGMIAPKRSLAFDPATIANHRKAWIDAWLAATSK